MVICSNDGMVSVSTGGKSPLLLLQLFVFPPDLIFSSASLCCERGSLSFFSFLFPTPSSKRQRRRQSKNDLLHAAKNGFNLQSPPFPSPGKLDFFSYPPVAPKFSYVCRASFEKENNPGQKKKKILFALPRLARNRVSCFEQEKKNLQFISPNGTMNNDLINEWKEGEGGENGRTV